MLAVADECPAPTMISVPTGLKDVLLEFAGRRTAVTRGTDLMRRAFTCMTVWALLSGCLAVQASAVSAATTGRVVHAGGDPRGRAAAQEPATLHMKLLASTAGPLFTDGRRWAAYEPGQGTTRLWDALTGHSLTRSDPEGCAGGLVAAGGGVLLYACGDPECPGQAQSCRFPPHNPLEVPSVEEFESRRYVAGEPHHRRPARGSQHKSCPGRPFRARSSVPPLKDRLAMGGGHRPRAKPRTTISTAAKGSSSTGIRVK